MCKSPQPFGPTHKNIKKKKSQKSSSYKSRYKQNPHGPTRGRQERRTSSRSSYCSMSFFSLSASSMFSCRSLPLWELCCSICISMSFRVSWKCCMASLRCSSYSRERWPFSSCGGRGRSGGLIIHSQRRRSIPCLPGMAGGTSKEGMAGVR